MAFNFDNDSKLPAALAGRMAAAAERREAAGFVDSRGIARPSAESRDWHNAVTAWKAAGKPAAGRAALEAERARLRAAGHNV